MNNQILLVIFVAMTGLALMTQALVAVAFFFFAKKNYEKLRQDFDDLRESAVPFLKASQDVLVRLTPQIEPLTTDVVKAAASMRAISADVAEITAKVRVQVDDAQASTTEVLERLRAQAIRADGMITNLLDLMDRAGVFLQTTVAGPVRQVSGILAGARAVMNSLRSHEPAPRPAPAANDSETFI